MRRERGGRRERYRSNSLLAMSHDGEDCYRELINLGTAERPVVTLLKL